MPTRQRSAWRRRWPISRRLRVAVPIAIPVALAVTLGVFIAVSSGGHVSQVNQSALANCASPAADASTFAPDTGTSTSAPDTGTSTSAPVPARTGLDVRAGPGTSTSAPVTAGSASAPDPAASASASASATPCPSATASVNAVAAASPSASAPPVNPEAGRPDLAEANPVDPTGAAISLNQTPAQAANSLNCTLIVPNHPLSARGLATPWQLSDGCSEANPNEEAFVESTILAPNGKLKVYDPLVITQGTTPAATPTVPVIPRGAQVIINVGFNGNNLVLEGGGAFQGRCIDAFGNSIIAQTSACNAAAFYADANFQIATGRLRVPRLGTGTDGQACESTRASP